MDALREKLEEQAARGAALYQLNQEAVALLDRVELPGDCFPFCVDLFLPGPLFEAWRMQVLENRRQRALLTKEGT